MKTLWKTRPLKDLSDRIFVGIASAATHAYRESGVLLLRNLNIKEGGIDRADKIFIDPEYEKQHARKRLRAGDVLTVRTGYAGVSAVVPEDLAGSQCFTSLVTRPNERLLDSNFLANFLNSPLGERAFSKSETGGSQKNVNAGSLEELLIPVPPIEDQKRISGVLSVWASAINSNERLITAKVHCRDAFIQSVYTLSDRRGSSVRFSELLKESMVAGSSGRHAKKITVKLYGKGVITKEEKRRGSEQTQYFVRRSGQLIYSKLDFLNGAFGIIPPELDGYESTLDLPSFDISPSVNPIWLLSYLTRQTYYTRQVGLARGQRKARRVHPADLLDSILQVPPRDFQDRVAEVLTASQCDIDKSKRLLESLKTQKRGLMQKLLTGQWRLKTSEAEAA